MGDKFFTSIFPDIPPELIFDGLEIARIEKVKFKKKSNILELTMLIDECVDLVKLAKLERYIVEKLKLKDIDITMKYIGEEKSTELVDTQSVFEYVTYKHPAIKGLFNNANTSIENNDLTIRLGLKCKEILETRKINKLIEDIVLRNYGLKLKVTFIDGNIVEYDIEREKKIVLEKIGNVPENSTTNKTAKTEKKSFNYSSENKASGTSGDNLFGKGKIKEPLSTIASITVDSGKVSIEGDILNVTSKEIRNGKVLVIFDIYDGTTTINAKAFIKSDEAREVYNRVAAAKRMRIEGVVQYDPYAKELAIIANMGVKLPPKPRREDTCDGKRVELHLHTKMSAMDAVNSATEMIETAARWGHKAIAITDHGVVQAFPEAHQAAKANNIKVIYGTECYLVSDKTPSVYGKNKEVDIDTTYVVLDIETTGLSSINDKITEFGMVKIEHGEIIDTYETFVNPEVHIPDNITQITGITDEMVENAPKIDEVIPKVLEFVGDLPIVAHNANFDIGFIRYNAKLLGYELNNVIIDSLQMSRDIFPNFKKHKLGILADNLGIEVDVAHRALDDVITLVKVFNVMIERLKDKDVKTIADIDNVFKNNFNLKNAETYHATILVKNYTGLKNLYKLVSFAHVDYFYKKPRIPISLLKQYKEGLLLGSACEQGQVYKAILNDKPMEEIVSIVNDYDYLEIMPDGNNNFLIREGMVKDEEQLHDINRKIIELGEKCNKLVVATGDAHFLNPEDEIYRRILMFGQGFFDADLQPPLYLKTTNEMLDDFAYLGEDKAREFVITNTNLIADMCDEIQPVPDGTFPPKIPGAEEEIETIAYTRAKEIYGDPLPDIVQQRLDKELNSIIKNGFSVMYIIAQKLVAKSNADGYIVGSRGSVGSSFAATMTGITEVNPLPPHYVCPNCKHSDFDVNDVKCGFDLPDKNCPKCGTKYNKNGIDIPFETFLGFDGDKAPDIDLNFSGEYQNKAHRYTQELFGTDSVYKAGTIGTMQDKTAYGFVKKYYETKNMYVSTPEINRIARGCVGVKRTTGQHPGGMIVIPDYKDVYDFCPVQYPADDDGGGGNFKTTHFDFHSIHDNVLKLDILGHDDPTMIKMLEDLTGINIQDVPLDDKETMSLFVSTEALGVKPEQINSTVGSFAVPEFGTKFVRQMLVDTKPKTFEELLRISGLSHGTDVWLNNAQDLILNNIAPLSETICTRDDIMLYLLKQGLQPKMSFKIMENVRKGKGLTEEMEQAMLEQNVPDWYIASCKKIKYMFPKAHAAAYVTMAFKIAWFKVHKPEAFYTAYFTVRADDFDANIMIKGKEIVKNKIKEYEVQGNNLSTKDKNVLTILEVVNEMYERGIKFLPITLKDSHATKFGVEPDGIRPPLNALPGLGIVAAKGIYNAVKDSNGHLSVEDLRLKAKIGKTIIETLEKEGCLEGMMKTNQYSFF